MTRWTVITLAVALWAGGVAGCESSRKAPARKSSPGSAPTSTPSRFVTRDELNRLLAVPPGQAPGQRAANVKDLVAQAFNTGELEAGAAAALSAADGKTAGVTGALAAIDEAIRTCADNLANADATGYRGVRARVDANGVARFAIDHEQAALEETSRDLDLGIQGDGFFRVKLPGTTDGGFAYTRSGNFFVNNAGQLVLGLDDGYPLDPPITLPNNAVDVSINRAGVIEIKTAGTPAVRQAGQIVLARFRNPDLLQRRGAALFVETDASGQPAACKPGDDGAGVVLQGYLEGSNVNVERERLRMQFLQNWRAVILKAVDATRRTGS